MADRRILADPKELMTGYNHPTLPDTLNRLVLAEHDSTGAHRWVDVTNPDYGASGSDQATTGSITTGTNTLTLAAAIDFVDGQGMFVAGAGVAGADLITQISSGGGTVNLVLADNASTTVSGAAVNHDDTTAIHAAVDAADAAGGGAVQLPKGIYIVSQSIILPDNVTLTGVGHTTIIKAQASHAGGGVIEANAKSDFSIINLKIDGNYDNAAVTGVYVHGDCGRYLIDNVWVYDCEYNGIWAGGEADADLIITNCRATGRFNDDGIMIHTATRFFVSNCYARNSIDSNNNCFSTYQATSPGSGEGSFVNCISDGGATNGLSIEGNSHRVIVKGFQAYNSASAGIKVQSSVGFIEIDGFLCDENAVTGISAIDVNDLTISNGYAMNSDSGGSNGKGIYINNVDRLVIDGVKTEGNTIDASDQGTGLHIYDCDNVVITNCIFNETKTNTVYVTSCNRMSLQNNTIKGGNYGADLHNCNDIKIEGNDFDGSVAGMRLTTCPDSIITGNKGLGTGAGTTDFIRLISSGRACIANNHVENYGGWAIAIQTSSDCVISSNVIVDQQGTKTQDGISIANDCDYCIVGFNNLKGYQTTGISMGSGTGHVNQYNIENAT